MTDYRYGDIAHPAGGYRYGDIAHAALDARTVGTSSGVPGATATVALGGTWTGNKTATLGGVALSLSNPQANSITFVVPTPYADGESAFNLFALDTAYDLVVDDDGSPVTGSFTIAAPTGAYTYVPAITGSPWIQSSAYFESTDLANGNSAIWQVTAGGPFVSVGTDGLWISQGAIVFKVKGYNASGWSTSWATFDVRVDPALAFVGPAIGSREIAKNEPVVISSSDRFVGVETYALTGTLPTGMTFDTATGSISGETANLGTAAGLVITATDGIDQVDSDTFAIEVISSGVDGPVSSPVRGPIRGPMRGIIRYE